MSLANIWNKIKGADSFRVAHFEITPDNTDAAKPPLPLQPKEEYFEVMVNELYLSYKRKWFKEYDPVVYVVSEFIYERQKQVVPFVVGPSLMEGKIANLPDGMIFENVKVAGLHPYRGGDFGLGVVLARSKRVDYLRKIIKIITDTAATYTGSFATLVSQYTKVADVVLNSIDALFDSHDLEPLIGYQRTYTSGNNAFAPGYHVLLNEDESNIDEHKFFVKKNRLCYGNTVDDAIPYRTDDYVLYSIVATKERSDMDLLQFSTQFYDLQNMVKDMPAVSQDENKIIIAKFSSLQNTIRMSPDLVRSQIRVLIDSYWDEIKEMIKDRKETLSSDDYIIKEQKDSWEQEMDNKALEILNAAL